MILRSLTALLVMGVVSTTMAAGTSPSEEATALIEQLQLREGAEPLSENSRWRPRRVVISLPPSFAQRVPEFEELFKKAAGSVEVIIDTSDNLMPSAETLAGADALIGLCSPPTMAKADAKLFWLHNYFVGMDRCKGLSDTQRSHMVFSNSKRLSGPTIAEHSIAMMMSLARGLPAFVQAQSKNEWQPALARHNPSGELNGKTILVVGLGGIGTQIARRAHGLGMRVIATRNSSRNGPPYVDYVGLAPELEKLAGEADVIVNALPLTDQTTGLFDADFFSAAKPGAIFLSVGRGKSTVTADLVAALESGQVAAAGLDVTDPEPLPADSPLWQMPNVIITPHVSGVSRDSFRRIAIIAVENLRRYVAGEPLLNTVNIEAGY